MSARRRTAERRARFATTPRRVWIAAILAVTFACFSPALRPEKEFTNWDDPGYVTEQRLVRTLDLVAIFDPNQHDVMVYYHPITVLSLALDYAVAGLRVRAYAFTNILLHVVNTLLVFVFVHRLSGRRFWVAAITALGFGIHPMHVESVAWIAGRKDLLYCLFFLAACIAYLEYLATRRRLYLALTFGAFVLSCLSKAMAVPLPLVLLLLDYLHRRRFEVTMLLEKVPFVLVSLGIALVAMRIGTMVPIGDFQGFTPLMRLLLASYGFVTYAVKLFVPYQLSAFYPYPIVGEDGRLPWPYPVMPAVAVLIVALPLSVAHRRGGEQFRTACFGIGFFIVTVALVLQFISVGGAVMADRYTYLSYVGPTFMVVALASRLVTTDERRRAAAATIVAAGIVLAVVSYRRTWVWTNSDTLWSDVIAKFPFRTEPSGSSVRLLERGVVTAYQNRGNYYLDHGRVDDAARDYQVLVEARVVESGPYINMGSIHTGRGNAALRESRPVAAQTEFSKALEMYSLALARGGNLFETHLNRGITYAFMGQHQKALEDFRTASTQRPAALDVLANVAFEELQLGSYPECIADATRIIAADPDHANAYFLRGTAHLNAGRSAEALADLQRAVVLNPGFGGAWYNLSVLYGRTGNPSGALDAARRARQAGHPVTDAYLAELASGAAGG